MSADEEFRPIPHYEGAYEVSATGVVRSIPRVVLRRSGRPLAVTGGVLSATVSNRGYMRVSLSVAGGLRRWGVHQLVAAAWLPKPPRKIGTHKGGFVVNHKDGSKLNNHVSNLEYIDTAANLRHARATGLLSAKGELNNKAKVGEAQVREIRELYSQGWRQVQLAARFGIDQTSVSRIVLRKSWAHVA